MKYIEFHKFLNRKNMKGKIIRKIIDLIAFYVDSGSFYYLKFIKPYKLGYTFGYLIAPLLKNQIKKNTACNILCFDRFVFTRDLRMLYKKGEYNYLTLNSCNFAKIFSLYVPKWMQHQLLFHQIIENPEHSKILSQIIEFSEGFLDNINRLIGIDILLFAGIDYYGDYGLHVAAKKKHLPFVALFYENYTIPFFQKSNIELYKGFNFKFRGNAIACFSKKTSTVFEESQVIEESRIFETGSPRYDYWREQNIINNSKLDTMLLFSYPGSEYGAPLNFVFVLHEFAKSSYINKHLRYIVKCKDINHQSQVLSILKGMDHCLNVLIEEPIEEFLSQARMAIGFNSLSILEALLSQAHMYIPYFSDAKLHDIFLQMNPVEIGNDTPGLSFLKSKDDLIAAIKLEAEKPSCITYLNENSRRLRVNIFKKYFWFPDDSTSVQELEKVLYFIKSDNHRN